MINCQREKIIGKAKNNPGFNYAEYLAELKNIFQQENYSQLAFYDDFENEVVKSINTSIPALNSVRTDPQGRGLNRAVPANAPGGDGALQGEREK